MTPYDIIAQVRTLVNDTRTPYRNSTVSLVGTVNQALKRIAMVRPDLFVFVGDIATTPDVVLQTLPSDAVRLMEIHQVVGGNAVTEADKRTLDRMAPSWVAATSGEPVNFMRHPRSPTSYFLYPPPDTGVELVAEYAKSPADYAQDDDIDLPDVYFTAIVDATVWLVESVDDEHANSGRADMFYKSFMQALSTALDARNMTDSDNAAVKRTDGWQP